MNFFPPFIQRKGVVAGTQHRQSTNQIGGEVATGRWWGFFFILPPFPGWPSSQQNRRSRENPHGGGGDSTASGVTASAIFAAEQTGRKRSRRSRMGRKEAAWQAKGRANGRSSQSIDPARWKAQFWLEICQALSTYKVAPGSW